MHNKLALPPLQFQAPLSLRYPGIAARFVWSVVVLWPEPARDPMVVILANCCIRGLKMLVLPLDSNPLAVSLDAESQRYQ